MNVEEKVAKTLAELGVTNALGVHTLFDEVRRAAGEEAEVFNGRVAGGKVDPKQGGKALRDRWLARKNGIVSLVDENWLKPTGRDLKPYVGREFNELRQHVQLLMAGLPGWGQATRDFAAALAEVKTADLTLPGYRRPLGSVHPLTRVQREIEEIFLGLGYSIETGPEVETAYYNFDALNIPATHPARDDMDTLYVDSVTVLRTHTSPVQIRAMHKHGAPLYILAPGKAYRRDNPDATHSPMFHQVEGLAVDTDITFADLKGTLDYFCRKFFGERVQTSFHPSYFPFTEPSGEVSISCFVCDGRGPDQSGQVCRACKGSGWIEVMGCGMVHPEVLRAGRIDPERYSGWAFGLGIDRFAMVKYDIPDIQLFFQGDLRFLEQFG